MSDSTINAGSDKPQADRTVRLPSAPVTVDAGRVRLGGFGPVFRPQHTADAGAVRLGGFGPLFR